MVATQNGVQLTDSQMRTRVERIIERKLWNTQRAATEIGCYAAQLTNWLSDDHATAYPTLRRKLHLFLEQHPDDGSDPVVPQEAAFAAVFDPGTATPDFDDLPRVDDRTPAQMAAEGEDVDAPAAWQLPAGFALIAPAARTIPIRPAGITIAKDFSRAGISRALYAALGEPAFVFVAANPDAMQPLIVAAPAEAEGAQKVTKGLDLSKSLAVWANERGIAPGFYPAEPDDERPGCWVVGF